MSPPIAVTNLLLSEEEHHHRSEFYDKLFLFFQFAPINFRTRLLEIIFPILSYYFRTLSLEITNSHRLSNLRNQESIGVSNFLLSEQLISIGEH